MGITKRFSVLEDITQQLLESKHTLTLGNWLFKIALDLKQYVATKLALEKYIYHCNKT
jgi:hypothetical protein